MPIDQNGPSSSHNEEAEKKAAEKAKHELGEKAQLLGGLALTSNNYSQLELVVQKLLLEMKAREAAEEKLKGLKESND